ncbi:uncharacterized protein ARMOST_12535 [Armillaria ostoyae]|uniref:Uncharacterized protein n=1 Tax=Armillaria ostoyae TaxID=47428 RepID=A0A284RK86_ARMOS|nr:uncharacterized protein ARMOST_12535 [Armillaria ostoyae]
MTSDDGYSDSDSSSGYHTSDNSGSRYDSDSNYNSDLSYGSLPHHKRCLPQKRARLRAAQQAQAHCFPTMSFTPSHPLLRSIPSRWMKLEPENRSPKFPDIYTAPSHSKVPEGHGTIYVVVASIDPADLHSMPALRPSLNDFLVFHDKYGKEEDGDSKDIVKSWSRSKQEFTTPVLEHFQELQKDVYGEDNAMTDTKAVLVDGEYHGGIALERSFCSEFHVRNAVTPVACLPM